MANLDFTQAMKKTSVLLANEAKKNFDGSHSPDGLSWLPLKRRRPGKRNKGKRGLGAKPLIDTGLLMASMQGRGSSTVKNLGPMSLEQGTAVKYGVFHQYGTLHIPKREFAGITNAMITRIVQYITDDVIRQLP
jgi:phage gpG-like protein